MDPKPSKINWKLVLLGGGAVVLVLVLVMKSGSTTNPPANSTPTTSTDGTSTNAGTPSNNGSFDVFTDPITGIRWILDASTHMWMPTSTPTTGGAGSPIPDPQGGSGSGLDVPTGGLPPLPKSSSTTDPSGLPLTDNFFNFSPSWLNPSYPTLPGGQ